MAEALYRKYRPQVFEDVVGQEPIERTLKNAIEQDKVSHAYLFCGPRGTGKTTTARLLAKALLCEKGPTPDPDGTCEDCELIADGAHPDVYELDAASRTGVDNVREEIISRVQFAPTRGRYKVYIIDEVHMLSTAAFNALLKTLEEPPSHVVFVLCTTDPQKVPETIHSRCQRFDFHRIAPESMVSRLGAVCVAENVEFEGEALDLIAHRAEGGLRNALTSLEQIIAFENGKVTLAGAERLLGSIASNDMAEIMAFIGRRDIASCFRWTAAYVETGADLAQFVRDMAEHARNLYVLALAGDEVELDVSETSRRELAGELQWFGPERASRLLGVLGDLSAELRTSSNPRLAFEIALTRMVRPDSDLTLAALAERVEALEAGYSSVAHVLPGNAFDAGAQDGGAASGEAGLAPRPSQQPAPSEQPAGFTEPSGRAQDPAAEGAAQGGGRSHAFDGAQPASAAPAVGSGAGEAASGEPPAALQDAASAQPVQSGVQGADAPSPLVNPAALQRVWQAALSRVRKEKQAYGVLFLNTKASFDEATGLVKVIFPADSAFAFNAVQKPDVQDALASALEKAAGHEVAFCYEQAGSQGQPANRSTASAQPARQPGASRQPAQQQPAASQQPLASRQSAQQPAASQQQGVSRQPAQQPAQEPVAAQQSSQQPTASQQPSAEPAASRQSASVRPAARQERPAPAAEAAAASSAGDEVPFDRVPYEDAPYDEVPYESVPYEEFEVPAPAAPSAGDVPADAGTSASPSDNAGPDGAPVEDPADLQAMLQAGFGDNVVFSEVE